VALVFAAVLGALAAWLTVYGSPRDWGGRMGVYMTLLWVGTATFALMGAIGWLRRGR